MVENYITSRCLISKDAVYLNDKKILDSIDITSTNFLLSVYQYFDLSYQKFYKMDNLSKLGWLASEILLKDSFKSNNYSPQSIGVVLSNKNSSLDADLKYYQSVNDIASPSLFVYTLPNIVIGEICIRHNFKGENAFFIFEKFDPDFIRQYVNNLLNNNTLEACVCGWVEFLEDEYIAVLFLVEKEKSLLSVPFTILNINNTYHLENG
jgi:hypothetical protein